MTNYNEAVAEARQLVKRSEEDQWRLAELTWEQVEAGKSAAQWARDIGVSATHAKTLRRIWKNDRHLDVDERPPFAEAYAVTNTPQKSAETEEYGSRYQAEAKAALRNMPPERKAEVARELLNEPEVAERVVHDSTARENVRRALDERYEQAPKPYPVQPAGVGSEPFELLSRFRKVHVEVDAIVQLILSGRAVVNDTERDALLKEAEWLEAAAGTIKSGLSAGSLDQALRAFQEEWLS
jgi:hypothetical protein